MKIICPNCKREFNLEDTSYIEIVNQVKNELFRNKRDGVKYCNISDALSDVPFMTIINLVPFIQGGAQNYTDNMNNLDVFDRI